MRIITAPAVAHKHPKHPATIQRRLNRMAEKDMTAEQMRTRGMRASLAIFKTNPSELCVIPAGWYVIEAISNITGEIRHYTTRDPENVRYIGNTDYMAYGYEPTDYRVFLRTANDESSWRTMQITKGKGRPAQA